MLDGWFLEFEIQSWRSEIGEGKDLGLIQFVVASALLVNPAKFLLTRELSHPDLDGSNSEIVVFDRYEAEQYDPAELRDPIKEAMSAESPPFGVIGAIHWFDARLYPGEHIFNDIWSRVHGGRGAPGFVSMFVKGLQIEAGPDANWRWDNAARSWLPIEEYRFSMRRRLLR